MLCIYFSPVNKVLSLVLSFKHSNILHFTYVFCQKKKTTKQVIEVQKKSKKKPKYNQMKNI